MKVVRGRAEARWLPSRFHFAAARLVAWAIFRHARPREQRGLILALDRHQNAVESQVVAFGVMFASTCYAAAALARMVHPAVAAILGVPAAIVAIHALMSLAWLISGLLRLRTPVRVTSLLVMSTLIAASAYFAVSQEWVRIVARGFLVVVAVNALAALVVWTLRHRLVALERQYEAGP